MNDEPYWWQSAGRPEFENQRELPSAVDVLIVGAGLTGLSAARTLAQRERNVLVVDVGPPGIGASSRNGGMIGGGHRVLVEALVDKFGKNLATRLLTELHIDSTSFCLALMEEERIECDFVKSGRYLAQWLPSHYERSARNLERLQELAPVEAEAVPKNRQKDELATDIYHGGIVHHHHGGLNPAKWVAGLLRAAIRSGAEVQGHTLVTDLKKAGAEFIATTSRGKIKAGEVLIATNGYTEGRFGRLGARIFPVPSYIIVTEELGRNWIRSLFPTGRMIVETRERHCYYRPSPDGSRIVFGGRAALFQAKQPFYQRELKGLVDRIFPELRGTAIEFAWKGNTGFTFDFTPHVGRIDGIYFAMGYCGNGNGMAPYLGHKAALQILNDPEGQSAFSEISFEKRWWYSGKPWFLKLADANFRIRDIWANVQNRRAA